jgi:hypothetical protein
MRFFIVSCHCGGRNLSHSKGLNKPKKEHTPLRLFFLSLIKMIQERLGEGDFVDSCLLQSLFVGDICQPNLPHAATRQFLLHTFLYIHSLNTHKIFCFAPNLVQTCYMCGFISGAVAVES